MSIQLQPPVLIESLVKTEPQAVIKNEPPEYEIGIENIADSSRREIIPDIKNVDIISHIIHGDSIKSETVPEDTLETKYSEIFVKTENDPLIKTHILNEDFNNLDNVETDEQLALKFAKDLNDISVTSIKSECPEETDFAATSWEEDKEKLKVTEAPVIVVEPHEYTSLAKDKHVCNYCQHASNKLGYIKRHIKNMHRVTTMFQCPDCPFNTKHKSSLRCHIIRKHKNTEQIQWFKCQLCDMKFKIKDQLTKHMLVHLTDKQIQDRLQLCPVCGKGFKAGFSLRTHMRMVHNNGQKEILKCQECEYTTVNRQYLNVHVKKRHMDFGQNQLESHTKAHEKRYHCNECDYNTYKQHNLNSHKLVHLKPEEIQYFYCYHCNYKFKQKSHLRIHIFRWHFKNEKIKYQSKWGETKHKNKTENLVRKHEMRYHCDECNYTTYNNLYLNRHKLIHLKPKKIQYFYCYHCSYKSKRKFTLKNHIWKHFEKEEVAFHCYMCDFMTLKRESIIEHIEKHPKVQIKSEIYEDEEIIPDVKDVDIVSHILCQDSIKSETVPNDIFETKHSESVDTQVFVKTENAPLIETEDLNEGFSVLNKLEIDGQCDLNFSEDLDGINISRKQSEHTENTDFTEFHTSCETASWEEANEKIKIFEAPAIPVEQHEYTSLGEDKYVCNHCQNESNKVENVKRHIRKIHREVTTMYQCPYCSLKSKYKSSVQLHIIRKHKDTEHIQVGRW